MFGPIDCESSSSHGWQGGRWFMASRRIWVCRVFVCVSKSIFANRKANTVWMLGWSVFAEGHHSCGQFVVLQAQLHFRTIQQHCSRAIKPTTLSRPGANSYARTNPALTMFPLEARAPVQFSLHELKWHPVTSTVVGARPARKS